VPRILALVLAGLTIVSLSAPLAAAPARTVTDAVGREVVIPKQVDRIICSGPGCLRLVTYLQAQDRVVAVDDLEARSSSLDARPYALANPQFKELPVFGGFRGQDNPERIVTLDPQPQVIFKTYPSMGHDAGELQRKTGIPVICLSYGDLGKLRSKLFSSLRLIGRVLDKEQRAEQVVSFFQERIDQLTSRTTDIPASERPRVFIGGVAFKGAHGYRSTEPGYPPFEFVNARNVAFDEVLSGREIRHSVVSKEKILQWDPDVLFLDLASLQLGGEAGGLAQLKNDPAYRILSAVEDGQVYGLLPYNWYTKNFGSILANAFFLARTLYPERFSGLDPERTAESIYTFLVGEPVFDRLNRMFDGLVFQKLDLS